MHRGWVSLYFVGGDPQNENMQIYASRATSNAVAYFNRLFRSLIVKNISIGTHKFYLYLDYGVTVLGI